MTPYDPETGLRIDPSREVGEVASAPAGSRWRPNPFLLALTGIWVLAGGIGVLAWPVGAGTDSTSGRPPVLVLAAVCLLTAAAAGVAHLAVLAAGWRAPEE